MKAFYLLPLPQYVLEPMGRQLTTRHVQVVWKAAWDRASFWKLRAVVHSMGETTHFDILYCEGKVVTR